MRTRKRLTNCGWSILVEVNLIPTPFVISMAESTWILKIVSVYVSWGDCVDPFLASKDDGTAIIGYHRTGASNQKWVIKKCASDKSFWKWVGSNYLNELIWLAMTLESKISLRGVSNTINNFAYIHKIPKLSPIRTGGSISLINIFPLTHSQKQRHRRKSGIMEYGRKSDLELQTR